MYNISQLEKQQVGLRLPKYLVEEIDEFRKNYLLNRTDIITEAIKSYLAKQREEEFYKSFDSACKEVRDILDGKIEPITWKEMRDELRDYTNS